MKVRCIWHVLLGIILPWLPLGVNLGGLFLFGLYEYLQYKYLSRRDMKDDSFKDVYECAVPYIVSSVVRACVLTYINLAELLPVGLESVV